MTLSIHSFDDPELDAVLELFLGQISELLGGRLTSVLLYGSVVFYDLAPGYGDLDFLAVVEGDLSARVCRRLVEARGRLRNERGSLLPGMIEGVFLPRHMLDPAVSGSALWWGTSAERIWLRNQLGWFAMHAIRRCSVVLWGADVRSEIPVASIHDLLIEVANTVQAMRMHGVGGNLHSVDWLLTAARLLLWLREDGKISSKSEAADWGYLHAQGAWRQHLPWAKQVRLNPDLAHSPAVRSWLGRLDEPIREACAELERALEEQSG